MKSDDLQTPIRELSSPGRRHFDFGALICHISVPELGVVHRFVGLHQQLLENNHILPKETPLENRRFPINSSEGADSLLCSFMARGVSRLLSLVNRDIEFCVLIIWSSSTVEHDVGKISSRMTSPR